jgi:sugar transferase (PEP-CTERM/EpsH1 system associated)
MSRKDQTIRVMFVAPCFGVGGLERVILELVANIDRSRFTPSFCTLLAPDREMYRAIERLDLSCSVLDKGDGINLSLPARLARLMRRERIDVVNAHDIGATLYAAPAARLAGISRVVHADHSQILTKTRHTSIYRLVMRRFVEHTVTVSRDLADYLAREYGIERDRITIIPNGIDVSRFADAVDSSRVREELGIGPEKRIIGTIGRLTEQKGTEYLIRAFAGLARDIPDLALVVVGDGELRPGLERLASELGAGSSVVFAGIREEIPEFLNLFDLFVLPSLWEGQPLTLLEAMAAGKPVIAADVGGNVEILRGGDLGVLVPPRNVGVLADAMRRLLADRSLAQDLGRRSRAHAASEFGASKMTRRYERVFDSLLSGRSSRS